MGFLGFGRKRDEEETDGTLYTIEIDLNDDEAVEALANAIAGAVTDSMYGEDEPEPEEPRRKLFGLF